MKQLKNTMSLVATPYLYTNFYPKQYQHGGLANLLDAKDTSLSCHVQKPRDSES